VPFKIIKLIILTTALLLVFQLYVLQQVGMLKTQMEGSLTNVTTQVNINKKEFNANLIEAEINNFRVKNNLNKLTRYEPLCELAKLRVNEIKTDWSHKGFELRNDEIYTNYCNKGALICTKAGENLAKGDFIDEKDVVLGWENSPDHKENMLTEYNVQCVEVSGTFYVSLFALTEDTNYLKKQQEQLLSTPVTYSYEKVVFWENQKELNIKYMNNWENGIENPHYDQNNVKKLLDIFQDKIDISYKLWDGFTNSKISNQESLDLENKYWELANKSAKISKELNEKYTK